MGMTTHVWGYRPPDGRWRKMKEVWDACVTAGVDPPPEVYDFFEGEPPDDAGVEVDLGNAVTAYSADMREGYDVNLDLLPPGIKIIRFCNSY